MQSEIEQKTDLKRRHEEPVKKWFQNLCLPLGAKLATFLLIGSFCGCQTSQTGPVQVEVPVDSLEEQKKTNPPKRGPGDLMARKPALLDTLLAYEIGPEIDLSPEAQLAYQHEWDRFHQLMERFKEGKRMADLPKHDQDFVANFKESRPANLYFVGTTGDGWYNGGGPYKISASTTLDPSPPNSYYADNAHDFDLRTAWVEGMEGQGTGAYIDFFFKANSPAVSEFHIYNGYCKNPIAWKNNSRVKDLKVYVDSEPFMILSLKDQSGIQRFSVKEALQSNEEGKDLRIRFEIISVYPGDKYEDVAISEIEFDGPTQ